MPLCYGTYCTVCKNEQTSAGRQPSTRRLVLSPVLYYSLPSAQRYVNSWLWLFTHMKKYIHLPCSVSLTWISPAFPKEQLLFIHKVTESMKAWWHLHLTSCRLTYVNLALSHTHKCTQNLLTSNLAMSHPPWRLVPPSPCFSSFQYTICFCFFFSLHICICCFVSREFIWRRHSCQVLEPFISNQSKRDYWGN